MVVHYKKQEVHTMATKTANVTARIQPNIKEQAEAILDRLGIPGVLDEPLAVPTGTISMYLP